MNAELDPGPDYVLVVDDDPSICEMLVDALSAAGHRVKCVGAADEALQAAEAASPAAALIDFMLKQSRVSSVELAGQLRRRGVPVVMMSGLLDADDVLSQLPYRYLKKPFRLAALLAAVGRRETGLTACNEPARASMNRS